MDLITKNGHKKLSLNKRFVYCCEIFISHVAKGVFLFIILRQRGLQMVAMHGQPYDQYAEKGSVNPFRIRFDLCRELTFLVV